MPVSPAPPLKRGAQTPRLFYADPLDATPPGGTLAAPCSPPHGLLRGTAQRPLRGYSTGLNGHASGPLVPLLRPAIDRLDAGFPHAPCSAGEFPVQPWLPVRRLVRPGPKTGAFFCG